jgi:nitrate/nitrite transporter NarK
MGIAAMSMLMASFSTNNIGGLVFLQGILFGLSGSLIYLVPFFNRVSFVADIQTAYTAPSHWFKKKRGLCTGIASCGGGLGGAAFAIVSPLHLQTLQIVLEKES